LIPSMTTAQRTAISSPADGLLVYDLTTTSFWYYKSTAWSELGAGGSGGSVSWNNITGIPTDIADGDDINDGDNDATNEIQDLTPYQTIAGTSSWDKNASDDFDGAFSSLTGIPQGLSDGDDTSRWSLAASGIIYNDPVGIGVSDPDELLHVAPSGNVLFGDSLGGAGSKMMWIPSKGAFRAGTVHSISPDTRAFWDINNIGMNSTAWGEGTLADGLHSMAWGNFTFASGNLSTAWGQFSNSQGLGSTTWGTTNNSTADFSTTWGIGNNSDSYLETVLGRYAISSEGDSSNWVSENQLFAIGNGTGPNARNNALTVLKNGNIGIDVTEPEALLHVDDTGNVLFGDSLQGGGSKMMWIPSKAAFRTGNVFSVNWDLDSIGMNSMSWGGGSKAIGSNSTSWGASSNQAIGDRSTVWGEANTAEGFGSTSWGGVNKVKGSWSTAWGFANSSS